MHLQLYEINLVSKELFSRAKISLSSNHLFECRRIEIWPAACDLCARGVTSALTRAVRACAAAAAALREAAIWKIAGAGERNTITRLFPGTPNYQLRHARLLIEFSLRRLCVCVIIIHLRPGALLSIY